MEKPVLPGLKLPRKLEADPKREALEALLQKDLRPLWEKSEIRVAHVPFSPALEDALRRVQGLRQLERGLDRIEQVLGAEKKGLDALREKQGTPSANRVSRLLLIACDGADRFYRGCEKTLLAHGDRLLCVAIDATSDHIGNAIFGPDKTVKALLVSDREAVTSVLLALAES